MKKFSRYGAAIVMGLVLWVVVATLGNFVLRASIAGYRAEEAAMSFSLISQLGRLAIGVVSTTAAAAATAAIARGSMAVVLALGCILLALFVPAHISLRSKFPLWYHAFFLISLPLVAYIIGAAVTARQTSEQRL